MRHRPVSTNSAETSRQDRIPIIRRAVHIRRMNNTIRIGAGIGQQYLNQIAWIVERSLEELTEFVSDRFHDAHGQRY